MIYLIYLVLVPISLLITLVAMVFAPILPIFATMQEGLIDNGSATGIEPRLPKWLNWFQTPDNSLWGDQTFKQLNPPCYWSEVKWLWRNPAYAFALRYIPGEQGQYWGDNTIRDNDNAKAGWCFVKAGGLFQFTWIYPIGFNRCIMVNLGWNIRALVDDNVQPKPNPYQATFVFSPRISGFRTSQ